MQAQLPLWFLLGELGGEWRERGDQGRNKSGGSSIGGVQPGEALERAYCGLFVLKRGP